MAVGDPLEPHVQVNYMTGARKAADPKELMKQLGYNFAKPELLQDALTHPSLAGSRARTKSGAQP